MKILIACEMSGVVRRAFRDRCHNAWSCDIVPALDGSEYHLQGDALKILGAGWDMLIAFPPCTHLAVSGAAHFAAKRADGRQQAGINFFMAVINAHHIPKIAVENPVGIMSTLYRKPDQIIQPYEYGHPESKKTCLWLKGLPKLVPTKIMEPIWYQNADGTDYKDAKGKRYSPSHFLAGRMQEKKLARWANQTASGQNKLGPSPERATLRSMTYQGIADAMAAQWG